MITVTDPNNYAMSDQKLAARLAETFVFAPSDGWVSPTNSRLSEIDPTIDPALFDLVRFYIHRDWVIMTRLTWNRAVLAPSLIATALTAVLWVSTPEASASPLCEHRSASHLAEHGGRMADDSYHVARGEAPSCDDASDRSGSDHNDDDSDDGPIIHHRDKIKPSWRDLF